MTKQTKQQLDEARSLSIETAKAWCPVGSRVGYLVLKYSKSGESRRVAFIAHAADGGFWRLDKAVARVCGYTVPKDGEGVMIRGFGTDTGREAIENLSRALYGSASALIPDRL